MRPFRKDLVSPHPAPPSSHGAVRRFALGVALLLLGAGVPLAAQVAPRDSSPRIGLVLSGGGARGAAHVGVLEVLEEYGVPVHVIVGTSMGAVVGGLYAAGLTPAEVAAELAAVDWPLMLTDRLPRRALPFRRLEEDREFLTQFELTVERGVPRLPAGLIAGHNVESRLERLLLPAASTWDFDRLAIPFRAVATDLERAEMVVLGEGDLSLAVRASLSLPAIFAPVDLDGRLLVDGGVVRNLPVDVARELGVDVLIAVDVGTSMVEREEIRSLLDVSAQLTHILTHANAAPQRVALGERDVLILPELGDLSIMDFHRWEDAVRAGREAARAMEGRLRALAVAPEAHAAELARRRRPFRAPPVVSSVRVVPPADVPAAALLDRVRTEPGEVVDPARLEADLLRLHGLKLFERLHTRIEGPRDSATLVIVPEPKRLGASSLRFGLGFVDDLGGGDSGYNLRSSLWLRNLNRAGGEARVDVQVGEPGRLLLELYQPLYAGAPLFVAARGEHDRTDAYLRSEAGTSASRYYMRSYRGTVELGGYPSRATELRAGLFLGWREADPRREDVELPGYEAREGGVAAALTLDRLDDAAFPHRGTLFRIAGAAHSEALGSATTYESLEGAIAQAIPVGRHTIILGAEAGARSAEFPLHDPYALGGLFRLTGRRDNSVVDRQGALLRAVYLRRLEAGRVFLGASAEAGGVWPAARAADLGDVIPAGAVFVGVRTLLGPAYLTLGHAKGGGATVYLSIGRRGGPAW